MNTRRLCSLMVLICMFCIMVPWDVIAQTPSQMPPPPINPDDVPLAVRIIVMIGMVMCFLAGIWLLIVAFKESVGWGLACLFIPFAYLAFIITHWREACKPFLVWLLALAMIFGSIYFTLLQSTGDKPQWWTDLMSAIPGLSDKVGEISEQISDEEPKIIVSDKIHIGDTKETMISVLGEPQGQFRQGDEWWYYYGSSEVLVKHGKVVRINE